MLKQTVASSDRNLVLDLGNENSLVELGTFQDIIHNHATNDALSWELKWGLGKALEIRDPFDRDHTLFADDLVKFSCSVNLRQDRLTVENLSYQFDNNTFSLERKGTKGYELNSGTESYKLVRAVGRPGELPSPVKFYGFPDQVRAYYQNAGFLSDFELALENSFAQMYYLGPLRDYPRRQYVWAGAQPIDMGRRGERAVDALLASQKNRKKISRGRGRRGFTLEEYVAWWLKELDLIHSFSVRRLEDSNLYRVYVQKASNSAEVLITDVGFGVSQILPALVLCYYVPEGSTIILEQPEIHLHPNVQAGLADVFIDATQKRNVQIILESHSEHLLRRLQRRIAEEKITNSDAMLYFSEIEKGTSRLKKLELDQFGNIVNWPSNFFGDEFGEIAAISEAAIKRQMRDSA